MSEILPLGLGAGAGSRETRAGRGRGAERKPQLALKEHSFSQKLAESETVTNRGQQIYFIKLVCKRFL